MSQQVKNLLCNDDNQILDPNIHIQKPDLV